MDAMGARHIMKIRNYFQILHVLIIGNGNIV